MFDDAVYERGAMATQALRHRLGAAAFASCSRRWVTERRYGTGSTEDFTALAESGQRAGPDRLLRRLAAHPGPAGRDRGERSRLRG
jgi:hypothetical protein